MSLSLWRDISSLRILFVRRDKLRLAVMLVLMFAGSTLEAVGIGIIPGFVAFLMKPASLARFEWLGEWTASLPDTPSSSLMLWASLLLIGFMVGKSLFLAFVYYVQFQIVNGFRVRLSCRMFSAYQGAPYEWLLQRSTSEIQRNIINDVNQVVTGIMMPLLDVVMAFLMTLFIVLAMLMTTQPIALLGVAITAGGVGLVIWVFRRQMGKAGTAQRRENKNIIQSIQQGFGALVDSRIVGCEACLRESFKTSIVTQSRMAVIAGSINKSVPLAIETVALAGLLVIFLIISYGSPSLADAVPVMSVLGVATIRLRQVAGRVVVQFNLLNQNRAFIPELVRDIKELETIERQRWQRLDQRPEVATKLASFERLELEKVSYAYPDTDARAVQNVSLSLERGEAIAFVGVTGCGKSTMVNLILGLLEPQSGTIKVNGVDIFSSIVDWRKHLGYIPQTIFLLDDTIRANIAFGEPNDQVVEAKLHKALRSARLDEFVSGLPQGLDTMVGERGVRLSGGQRQRIGIARALYFDPEVLVMDEATSALDNKTEVEVMEAIHALKKERTLIMIAHRLSTVEDCDRLYFFDKGNLVASGSFESLHQSVPGFTEMVSGRM